jgi:hypothetical protein
MFSYKRKKYVSTNEIWFGFIKWKAIEWNALTLQRHVIWRAPKLFDRIKREFTVKTKEE